MILPFLNLVRTFHLIFKSDHLICVSERKIEYDFDRFGDSPTCLGQSLDIAGQDAIGQGFGITETGGFPDNLLEAKVEIIENQQCVDWLNFNATGSKRTSASLKENYPEGFSDSLMCSIGIYNSEKNIFSVSSFCKSLGIL